MWQTACLVLNPIIVDSYASLFSCTTAVRTQIQLRPLRKTLTSGLGLDDMSVAWPPWFNYWFSFTLAYSRISHEYSSLFIAVINLFLCFRFDALNELGAFIRTEFLCISVLKVLFVLRFYGPVNPMGSCRARSVHLTTRLLGRLSPLSG